MDDSTVIRFPNDNTVLRPTPGGKRKSPAAGSDQDKTRIFQSPRTAAGSVSQEQNFNRDAGQFRNVMPAYNDNSGSEPFIQGIDNGTGLNPLASCATPVISILIKLTESVLNDDINQLKYKLQDELKQFEVNASRSGLPNDKILQARYVLCTALDEIVVSTPWGQESDWSKQSLLSIFHGETWGGEKFFLLLERLEKEPMKNLDILELMYIILSLGFQGKYRVIDNGRGEVENLREDLYRQLRSLKNDFNKELSVNWKGITDRRGALIRYVPLWVVGALSGVILLAMYASFSYMLDQTSAPVLAEIQALGNQQNVENIVEDNSVQSISTKTDTSVNSAQTDDKKERLVRPPSYQKHDDNNTTMINNRTDADLFSAADTYQWKWIKPETEKRVNKLDIEILS